MVTGDPASRASGWGGGHPWGEGAEAHGPRKGRSARNGIPVPSCFAARPIRCAAGFFRRSRRQSGARDGWCVVDEGHDAAGPCVRRGLRQMCRRPAPARFLVLARRSQRTVNPPSPGLRGASRTRTPVTREKPGPSRSHATSSPTASADPWANTSTSPLGRLRTHPVSLPQRAPAEADALDEAAHEDADAPHVVHGPSSRGRGRPPIIGRPRAVP